MRRPRGKGPITWMRVSVQALLDGSVTHQMNNEQQNVWWKLVGIANWCACRDGTLRHGFGVPMTRQWLAERCQCKRETLDRVIAIGEQDKNIDEDGCRIKVWEDGTIELCNFKQYNPDAPILQAMLPPAVTLAESKQKVDSDGKRRAIHNKFQRQYPDESEFHLGMVRRGIPDDHTELKKKLRKDDRRAIHKAKRESGTKPHGAQATGSSRFSGMEAGGINGQKDGDKGQGSM